MFKKYTLCALFVQKYIEGSLQLPNTTYHFRYHLCYLSGPCDSWAFDIWSNTLSLWVFLHICSWYFLHLEYPLLLFFQNHFSEYTSNDILPNKPPSSVLKCYFLPWIHIRHFSHTWTIILNGVRQEKDHNFL